MLPLSWLAFGIFPWFWLVFGLVSVLRFSVTDATSWCIWYKEKQMQLSKKKKRLGNVFSHRTNEHTLQTDKLPADGRTPDGLSAIGTEEFGIDMTFNIPGLWFKTRRACGLCFPCRAEGGGAFSRPPLTRLLGHVATHSKRQSKERQKSWRKEFGKFLGQVKGQVTRGHQRSNFAVSTSF